MYEFIPERNISDEAKDFVKRLLTLDMTIRMTANEAIEHPWVRRFFIYLKKEEPTEIRILVMSLW